MVVHYPDLFRPQQPSNYTAVVDRKLFVERTNPPSAVRWMMKMGGSTNGESRMVYQLWPTVHAAS